ncbi:Transposon Ty3-G Gag-Pol polyprotein [Abeliophyllum distichum]|uniref:Transposon Ty3-G Gag-Pol polyprotein n=1 Tax=Abeliophyllum distichum TaxID=126358 RepID=A0ABD1VZ81_9LAMI
MPLLGHNLLSFMDAYSGYNQISMFVGNEEHTSFITDLGLYCYKMISFGLKNTRATYQKTVNCMFTEQIRNTIEVDVNDMLVKNVDVKDHIGYLEEMFEIFCKYQIKINSLKCAFETIKERNKFEWTDEYEVAFRELKELIRKAPLLSKPKTRERLLIYLVMSEKAVSSVLIRKKGPTQLSVNYDNARNLYRRPTNFVLQDGILYKRRFSLLLLRCVTRDEVDYIMQKIHEGVYGNHTGEMALAQKSLKQGYYWLTMKNNFYTFVKKCDKCQRFATILKLSAQVPNPGYQPMVFHQVEN